MENRPPYLTVLVLTAAILALGIWHMIPRTDDIYFLALVLPAVALCVAGSTMLLMRLFPQQPWNVFNIFILVVFFSGLYLKASPRIINSDLLKRTSGGISSMRPSDDLQVKMRKTAEEAVNLSWNSFHIRLSYSDSSVQDVDRLLEKINSLYRSGYYKESNLKFFSMIYGAYVGEVIKRDKNGHWEMDDPVVGKSSFPMKYEKATEFPCSWCYKRLAGDEGDAIWPKFELLVLGYKDPKVVYETTKASLPLKKK